VVPTPDAWEGLRSLPGAGDLPAAYAPLRGGQRDGEARRAEAVLAVVLAERPAAAWAGALPGLGVLVEVVDDLDRDGFRRRILDDPVNRELGRAVSYETDDWGGFEQIGPLLRCGPGAGGGPALHLPGVGEHTREVLADLGVPEAEVDALLAAGVARQG
jgi:crotonobetainyl-CoA:carnitine CoA-transferase CaiB-like acyl-CoA transferase